MKYGEVWVVEQRAAVKGEWEFDFIPRDRSERGARLAARKYRRLCRSTLEKGGGFRAALYRRVEE